MYYTGTFEYSTYHVTYRNRGLKTISLRISCRVKQMNNEQTNYYCDRTQALFVAMRHCAHFGGTNRVRYFHNSSANSA